jgi:hypothetical protein
MRFNDRSTPAQIDELRQLARTLISRGDDGTDLSMVLNERNAGFPTIDCADVHIRVIAKKLLA